MNIQSINFGSHILAELSSWDALKLKMKKQQQLKMKKKSGKTTSIILTRGLHLPRACIVLDYLLNF